MPHLKPEMLLLCILFLLQFGSPSLVHHEISLKQRYLEWAKNYTSPNPRDQIYCSNILNNRNGSLSQYDQDLFVFFNVFKFWPMHGKIGYYVDSGANEAKLGSNSFFFDACLGWKGLCVEPDPRYHAELKMYRSCELISECISDRNKSINMVPPRNGAFMKVGEHETTPKSGGMKCNSLANMLSLHNIPRVDFWSLDVEGHEMTVLTSVNFSAVDIAVLLVEGKSYCVRAPCWYDPDQVMSFLFHPSVPSAFVSSFFLLSLISAPRRLLHLDAPPGQALV